MEPSSCKHLQIRREPSQSAGNWTEQDLAWECVECQERFYSRALLLKDIEREMKRPAASLTPDFLAGWNAGVSAAFDAAHACSGWEGHLPQASLTTVLDMIRDLAKSGRPITDKN